ncbi:MAG: polysaccharide deacetylase family protein [Gemmatimonadaceae bacterium]|nr:polysaccharide deacetylase family protein [Chitinophagaceae bacterium]
MWYSVAICSFFVLIFLLTGCQYGADATAAISTPVSPVTVETSRATDAPAAVSSISASASEIIARKQVPILCYHQLRDWKSSDSKMARDYIVPEETFKLQLKMLADSGYKTITADQLYNYLNHGASLPEKPVMLTYDDTDLDQFTLAKPEMDKYGFKGTFFIMTVSIGRPRYMSKEQIRQLADEGHDIGSHTWNHENVKKYTDKDWAIQIEKPIKVLEGITGMKVKYFAYPFGLWNPQAIPHLKEYGLTAAFQLSVARDEQDPLHTIRRIIVPGSWSAQTLNNAMKRSFK